MKKIILLCIFISLFRISSANLNLIGGDKTDTEVLLKAPFILVGKVESFVQSGNSILERGSSIKVQVFDASVEVFYVLKGKKGGEKVLIKNLLRAENPVTWIGQQFLEKDKIYCFFLSPGNLDNEFIGIDTTEFAIETVDLKEKNIPEKEADILRLAAKNNIDKNSNERIAIRWFEILGDIFNADEDLEYCKKNSKMKEFSFEDAQLLFYVINHHLLKTYIQMRCCFLRIAKKQAKLHLYGEKSAEICLIFSPRKV